MSLRRLALPALLSLIGLLGLAACEDKGGTEPAADSPGTDSPSTAAPTEPGPSSQPAAATSSKTALGKGETPPERDQVDADGVVRRGMAIPAGDTVSVADCVAKATELDGKDVVVSGQVAQVCAKKGCWWVLENPESPEQNIRVTHKDYGFFVPRDAKGKPAVAFGTLKVKQMSEAEAKHMAEDEGKTVDDPSTLKRVELRLEASALEMRPTAGAPAEANKEG